MFKRILLSTDFSPASAWAAIHARHLCRLFGAKLFLHNAYDPATQDASAARERLSVLRQARLSGVENVELLAAPSTHPYESICDVAATHRMDLIVAGRHGEHSLTERMLGSTTERVVRHAPCSVLVAHPAQHEHLVEIKHVMVGSDLSEESEHALATAAALANKLESFVTLLHVYDILPPLDLLQEPYELHPDKHFGGMLQDKLEGLRKKHLDGLPAESKVLRDKSTVTAMCDYADDHQAGLLVVGTHGMTGLRRLLIGSVAERVVRHAPCSVLVTRKAAYAEAS